MYEEETPAGDCAACGECPLLHTRRAFLRDALGAAAGVLALLGAAGRAEAMPIGWTAAREARGRTRSYGVPAEDGARIDAESQVILVRWQGAMYAFALSCPHQNTALRWDAKRQRFQCPRHHSRYTPDGAFVSGRATRGMDRFGLRRDGASVVVDLDDLREQTDDPAAWAAATLRL